MAWAALSSAVGSVLKKSSVTLRAALATSSLFAITLTTANSAGQSAALALAERMLEINPASRSSCSARVLPVPVPPTMTPRCQRRGSRANQRSVDDISDVSSDDISERKNQECYRPLSTRFQQEWCLLHRSLRSG